MNEEITVTHESQIDGVYALINQAVAVGPHIITIKKLKQKRTLSQNAALHKYCEIMAEKMRDAGIDQKELVGKFKKGFSIPVSGHMIKDIFRTVGLAIYRKESTADLDTKEISSVHVVVDARFGEVTGITAPWPSSEPPVYGERD